MNTTVRDEKFFPIPGFPAYSATLDGMDVVRSTPATRGPTALLDNHRMKAQPCLRGTGMWHYQLNDAEGKRRRLSTARIAKIMLDAYGKNCDSCATA
jgi:hypothetical protein